MDCRAYTKSIGLVLLASGLGLGCGGDRPSESAASQELREPTGPAAHAPAAPAAEVPATPAAKDPALAPTGPCMYAYDSAATKLTWTAFKLTERVGVAGTFDKISAQGTVEAATPSAVFAQLSFEIDTGSVNSQNADRDKKLVASLFGNLADGAKISGKVVSIADGKGQVELSFGGVTKPVELVYTVSDSGLLVAAGKVDLSEYNGSAAVAALNKVCSAKHTGLDKVAKLWPDVDLRIESQLKKTCAAKAAVTGNGSPAAGEKPVGEKQAAE